MREAFDKLVATWKRGPLWKRVLLALPIVLLAVGVVAWIVLRFFGNPFAKKDPALTVAVERGEVIDGIVDRNTARDAELEAEGNRTREEREGLEDRIAHSGEGRNGFHDEVDRAAARGDIDAIDAARDRRRRSDD